MSEESKPEDPPEPDERPLREIASDDAEMLYAEALDSGNVASVEEDEDAAAYAVCLIENAKGERGWVVIIARGHSWEGLRVRAGSIFDTEKKAWRHVSDCVAKDREEYEARMGEDEDEADEEASEDGDSEDGDSEGGDSEGGANK